MASPGVAQRMRQRTIRIKEANRTLRRGLAESMAEGIAAGEGRGKIEDRLRQQFNLGQSRTKTIAQTEIAGAVEDARHEGRAQARVPGKSWLGSRSETSRPWHMEMERQSFAKPIANDAEFVLPQTAARTLYPRGAGLDAKDAANCKCSTIARYPGDTIRDARVVAHYLERGFLTDEAVLANLTESH